MGRFREAIFMHLRPVLRIHGDRRQGFTFSPKVEGLPWERDLQQQGTTLGRWTTGSARTAGLQMVGDADLLLVGYGRTAYADFAAFCADVLVHYHGWFPPDGHRQPQLQMHHPRQPSTAWADLLDRCIDGPWQRVFTNDRPGTVKAFVLLVDDGNSIVRLVDTTRGYRLVDFCTS
ncbi:MAG: hypothetical protein AAFV53_12225 [Myxococcota bacterium]